MRVQKVFKAGNSHVVSIPKDLSREMELTPGQRVIVAPIPQSESLVIKRIDSQSKEKLTPPSRLKKEFWAWLEDVLQEDADILNELAVR